MTTTTAQADSLEARFQAYWPTAEAALEQLYGGRADFAGWLAEMRRLVRAAAAGRPAELQAQDRAIAGEDWWAASSAVGYCAYVDRFGGSFDQVRERLDYLSELGVNYLHLLPLLKPRAGQSDGGFAVADFEDVDPALGKLADFQGLLSAANGRGLRIVVDLVCNHTADDHRWALAAKAGDATFADYYHFVEDPAEVEAWEEHLVDIFPDSAPGSFTYVPERAAWVWTTFYPFQWDLNYSNPAVFREMSQVMFRLANMGVAGFRLDSTAFLWKRRGTNSRNLPEVHRILAAWRALLSIVAPAAVLKAEAIERLAEVLPYFGAEGQPPECHLAYNNGVMAGLWASLASGSAAPVRRLIEAAAAKPRDGVWINYVRCHDDIILGALTPYVPAAEQRRTAAFLAGETPGSFADGRVFQTFDGVPSINGMAAALTGAAGGDPDGLRRLILLYAVAFALDGLPVIYMGDELALGNDLSYLDDPERAAEGRWIQRPTMDWGRADERTRAGSVSAVGFSAFERLSRVRRSCPALHARSPVRLEEVAAEGVLSLRRGEGPGAVQLVANFGAAPAEIAAPFGGGAWEDLLGPRRGEGPTVAVAPYEVLWMRRAA